MPLTTGRLDEKRRVGGRRAALNTEIRRAERKGNTALANSLGAQVAQDNLRRAELGVSNIGSADSDIKQTRAARSLAAARTSEAARLASSRPSADTPTTSADGPVTQGGDAIPPTPRNAGPDTGSPSSQPSDSQTSSPSTDPTPTNTEVVEGGTPSGDSGNSTPDRIIRDVTSDTPAPERPEGRIGGLRASRANAISRLRGDINEALDRGEIPDFDDSGLEEEDFSTERRRFFDEFEERHGVDRLTELLGGRVDQSLARRADTVALREQRVQEARDNRARVDRVLSNSTDRATHSPDQGSAPARGFASREPAAEVGFREGFDARTDGEVLPTSTEDFGGFTPSLRPPDFDNRANRLTQNRVLGETLGAFNRAGALVAGARERKRLENASIGVGSPLANDAAVLRATRQKEESNKAISAQLERLDPPTSTSTPPSATRREALLQSARGTLIRAEARERKRQEFERDFHRNIGR